MSRPTYDFRFLNSTVPTTEQLNAFFESIESYFNSTKLDENNIIAAGLSPAKLNTDVADNNTIYFSDSKITLKPGGLREEYVSVFTISGAELATTFVDDSTLEMVANKIQVKTVPINDIGVRSLGSGVNEIQNAPINLSFSQSNDVETLLSSLSYNGKQSLTLYIRLQITAAFQRPFTNIGRQRVYVYRDTVLIHTQEIPSLKPNLTEGGQTNSFATLFIQDSIDVPALVNYSITFSSTNVVSTTSRSLSCTGTWGIMETSL